MYRARGVELSDKVRDSENFWNNVGFMPSDAVDVLAMTPVEVDEVHGDETSEKMDDLYSVEATEARDPRKVYESCYDYSRPKGSHSDA